MKRDQYIPHDVSMRSNAEVFNMVEAEGAAGYGLYWGILEYLRSQNNYQGDIRAIKGIARQLKCRIDKAIRVLENYGLFVIENTTFYSTDLIEKMQPLEKKRAQKRTTQSNESVSQNEQTLSEKSISLSANGESLSKPSCNSLEIKQSSSLSKVKESKVKESKVSSSSKEDDVVAAVPVSLAWERYVDELAKEQTWIELMAMRSGLGEGFVHRFGEVLKHFKQHIQSLGNEKDIQSPSDAKRYFCFFNTPGSVTFRKLVDELQKPFDKGKYKHEDYDPATGLCSYCGIPIPADAPPRPNAQAVWNEGKWIY
jgi:hypothetical protein